MSGSSPRLTAPPTLTRCSPRPQPPARARAHLQPQNPTSSAPSPAACLLQADYFFVPLYASCAIVTDIFETPEKPKVKYVAFTTP